MNVTVQKWVFNPSLLGKVAKITGYNDEGEKIDGVYIVKKIDHDRIKLINHKGEMSLYVSEVYGNEKIVDYFEVIEVEGI